MYPPLACSDAGGGSGAPPRSRALASLRPSVPAPCSASVGYGASRRKDVRRFGGGFRVLASISRVLGGDRHQTPKVALKEVNIHATSIANHCHSSDGCSYLSHLLPPCQVPTYRRRRRRPRSTFLPLHSHSLQCQTPGSKQGSSSVVIKGRRISFTLSCQQDCHVMNEQGLPLF